MEPPRGKERILCTLFRSSLFAKFIKKMGNREVGILETSVGTWVVTQDGNKPYISVLWDLKINTFVI